MIKHFIGLEVSVFIIPDSFSFFQALQQFANLWININLVQMWAWLAIIVLRYEDCTIVVVACLTGSVDIVVQLTQMVQTSIACLLLNSHWIYLL